MGAPTAKRIAIYTGLFAGGSILACPVVGGVVGVSVGGAVAGLFSNTLASDLHDAFSRRKLDPLSNHHLQELAGRALAALIECYENEAEPPTTLQQWIPWLRRPDEKLSALARAAREHWRELDLSGDSEPLRDEQVHQAFRDQDRNEDQMLIPVDEWDRHLADIAVWAETRAGDPVWLREHDRRPIAEYIAPRYALAVRELVKADLDPSVGTGGRVFVALHLDLMRSMAGSVQRIDLKTGELLEHGRQTQAQLESIQDLLVNALSESQKGETFNLALALRTGLAAASATLDRIEQTLTQVETTTQDTNQKVGQVQAQLEELSQRLQAQTQANPDQPPILSDEDRATLERIKQHGDLIQRATAAALAQEFDQADTLLGQIDEAAITEEPYRYYTAKGDRWYFAGQYDLAVEPYETALRLRPNDVNANNKAVIAHTFARLGDLTAHRQRAIELAEANLGRVDFGSTDWAATQNNLGNAWQDMPTGDRAQNLTNAIKAYELALQVRTRDAHPVEWAATQNNLGAAWRNMPTGDRAQNLTNAIKAYELALQVRTRDAHPVNWAMTQNNLGIAWRNMPTGDRAQSLTNAIKAYELALQVYTPDAHPIDWAMTQNNLGVAWADLAEMDGEDRCTRLRQAIACSKAALLVRTPEALPHDHASTLKNLEIHRKAYEAAGCAAALPFDEIPPAE